MKLRPAPLLALALLAVAGWLVFASRHPGHDDGIEIRWHQGGIVLDGKVRDAETERILVAGATARLGGEVDQVIDWLVIDAATTPLADANALAQLIRLGLDGWHLQRRAQEGWLAVPAPGDPLSAEAPGAGAARLRSRYAGAARGIAMRSRLRHSRFLACASSTLRPGRGPSCTSR